MIIEIIAIYIFVIFLYFYFYSYWKKKWEKHKCLNEHILVDKKNKRFNYIEFKGIEIPEEELFCEFKIDKFFHPIVPYLSALVPFSLVIGLYIKNRFFMTTLICLITLAVVLFIPRYFSSYLVVYRKLSSYEKELGASILNGLLEEKKEI